VLRKLHVQGNGAVAHDAVMECLTMLARRPRVNRRILLVIGEGRDRSSVLKLDAVAQAAQRQNVLIYWMTYSPFLSSLRRSRRP